MNEDDFSELNAKLIDIASLLGSLLDRDLMASVHEYARLYARQAVARAAMEQYRAGRHSLATQILEGQR